MIETTIIYTCIRFQLPLAPPVMVWHQDVASKFDHNKNRFYYFNNMEINMDHEMIMAAEYYAFEISFTKEYAEAIGILEDLDDDLAIKWLRFGATHIARSIRYDGTDFVFVPPKTKRKSSRHVNRGRMKRRMN